MYVRSAAFIIMRESEEEEEGAEAPPKTRLLVVKVLCDTKPLTRLVMTSAQSAVTETIDFILLMIMMLLSYVVRDRVTVIQVCESNRVLLDCNGCL
jgi:hypothetical protein